jgi:hypothetical protein
MCDDQGTSDVMPIQGEIRRTPRLITYLNRDALICFKDEKRLNGGCGAWLFYMGLLTTRRFVTMFLTSVRASRSTVSIKVNYVTILKGSYSIHCIYLRSHSHWNRKADKAHMSLEDIGLLLGKYSYSPLNRPVETEIPTGQYRNTIRDMIHQKQADSQTPCADSRVSIP